MNHVFSCIFSFAIFKERCHLLLLLSVRFSSAERTIDFPQCFDVKRGVGKELYLIIDIIITDPHGVAAV